MGKVNEKLTIAAVLEHYGADLTRVSGTGWRPVKCPFHRDRTASASVNLEEGGFRCHACTDPSGEPMKGDAIAIIQKREGLDFAAACQWAEEVLGASSPRVPRSDAKPKRRISRYRRTLFE